MNANEWPASALRIYHTNAQSLRHKINDLECKIQDVDIVCLSETWLGPSVGNDTLTVINFNGPHRRDRPGQDYGGVAMYTKSNIPVKRRADLESPSIEIIWLELRTVVGKTLVGTIYRPPNSNREHWDLIQSNIERACETGLHTILCGDINQNMMVTPNPFSKILANTGLHMQNNVPTHRLAHSETCIDIMTTNMPTKSTKAILTSPILSLHNGLVMGVGPTVTRSNDTTVKTRTNYGRSNWNQINDDIMATDWSDVTDLTDLEHMVETWTSRFQEIVLRNTPVTRFVLGKNDKPWMTPELRRLIKSKDKAYRNAVKKVCLMMTPPGENIMC